MVKKEAGVICFKVVPFFIRVTLSLGDEEREDFCGLYIKCLACGDAVVLSAVEIRRLVHTCSEANL